MDFIREAGDTPWCLHLSYIKPHWPYIVPAPYHDMYPPETHSAVLRNDNEQENPHPVFGAFMEERVSKAFTNDTTRTKVIGAYMGLIKQCDDQMGRLFAWLKETGRWDDTLIVLTSDHGDYLGDYNMMLKGALPFRAITRVPFIWSDPTDRRPATSDALASTVDIAATILDRVGIEPFNGNQGRSLRPVMDHKTDVRDELLIEYNDGGKRLGFAQPARVRALVTPEWRYTIYKEQDWGELYDLKNDPSETHNRWDNAAHAATRAHLAERMNHHLMAQMDESPLADRIA